MTCQAPGPISGSPSSSPSLAMDSTLSFADTERAVVE